MALPHAHTLWAWDRIIELQSSFSMENGQVVLGKQTDFERAILNLLQNWP